MYYGLEIAHFLPEAAGCKVRLEGLQCGDETDALIVASNLFARFHANIDSKLRVSLDASTVRPTDVDSSAAKSHLRSGPYVESGVELRSLHEYVQDLTLHSLGLPLRETKTCTQCTLTSCSTEAKVDQVRVYIDRRSPTTCLMHRYKQWHARHNVCAKLARICAAVGGNQEAMLNEMSNPDYSEDDTQEKID